MGAFIPLDDELLKFCTQVVLPRGALSLTLLRSLVQCERDRTQGQYFQRQCDVILVYQVERAPDGCLCDEPQLPGFAGQAQQAHKELPAMLDRGPVCAHYQVTAGTLDLPVCLM